MNNEVTAQLENKQQNNILSTNIKNNLLINLFIYRAPANFVNENNADLLSYLQPPNYEGDWVRVYDRLVDEKCLDSRLELTNYGKWLAQLKLVSREKDRNINFEEFLKNKSFNYLTMFISTAIKQIESDLKGNSIRKDSSLERNINRLQKQISELTEYEEIKDVILENG